MGTEYVLLSYPAKKPLPSGPVMTRLSAILAYACVLDHTYVFSPTGAQKAHT